MTDPQPGPQPKTSPFYHSWRLVARVLKMLGVHYVAQKMLFAARCSWIAWSRAKLDYFWTTFRQRDESLRPITIRRHDPWYKPRDLRFAALAALKKKRSRLTIA